MNSLTTYWLCRKLGSNTEGPFTLAQLKAMYVAGTITSEAQLCVNGEAEWMDALWMLEEGVIDGSLPTHVAESNAAIAARMERYEQELKKGKKKGGSSGCAWLCLLFVILYVFFVIGGMREDSGIAASTVSESRPQSAIEPSAWDGSVSEAKSFIERSVRDPSTIKYNQWKNFTNDARHITTVDFTTTNGFGGPARETWVFSFDKFTGKLMYAHSGGKVLYDAEE